MRRTAAETRNYTTQARTEREINDRLTLGVELFGNSPSERGANSDFAFNLGGTWKLSAHLNLLFAGGRDIVGDTHDMVYIGLQSLRNEPGWIYCAAKTNLRSNATPTILCHDGGSRKKRGPAMGMIAAPPARMAGTEESGPPF